MSAILTTIATKFLESLADKLFAWAYKIYKLKYLTDKRNKEIDEKSEDYKAVLKEINDNGGKPTVEQQERLINAARSLIRDGKV